jgi:hypothetical protein
MTVSITVAGTSFPVPSNASNTNWAAQQVAFQQAVAAGINNLRAALTWHTATPAAGWSGTLQYAKDIQGRVWLRGYLTISGSILSLMTTLPSGYRPPAGFWVSVVDGSAFGPVVLQFLADGTVTAVDGANDSFIYFEPVNFDVQSF